MAAIILMPLTRKSSPGAACHLSRCLTALLLSVLAAATNGQDNRSHGSHGSNGSRHDWHQWRGPLANGHAPDANPPLRWGPETNIRWKTRIPGRGSATPIVWEDRIWVATAQATERVPDSPTQPDPRAKTKPPRQMYQFLVMCLDRKSGKELWRRIACEAAPHEGRHPTNTFASASPMTDGQRLYVSFGSRGIYCFSLDGKLIWQRDLGDMNTRYGWGEGASLTAHESRVVVNWDHEDQSSIHVLDAATGKTIWEQERDEPTSWATPLITEHGGKTQVVVSGTQRVRSYDLADGDVLWACGGQTINAIPSPIRWRDWVICMSGYRGALAAAIPLASRGDVTDSTLPWRHTRGTPYVPSPLLYGDLVYFTRSNTAVLTCLNAATGEELYQERIPQLNRLYASPVGASGRVYFTGRDGTTAVVRDGKTFSVLAVNSIGEPVDASPVLVGRQLLLRGEQHLFCIEEMP